MRPAFEMAGCLTKFFEELIDRDRAFVSSKKDCYPALTYCPVFLEMVNKKMLNKTVLKLGS